MEPINGQLTLKKLFYALTSSRQFQLILQETATLGMVKLLKVNFKNIFDFDFMDHEVDLIIIEFF